MKDKVIKEFAEDKTIEKLKEDEIIEDKAIENWAKDNFQTFKKIEEKFITKILYQHKDAISNIRVTYTENSKIIQQR